MSIRLVIRRWLREPMGLPPARGGNVQASVTRRSGDLAHTRRRDFDRAGGEIRHECQAGRRTHCIFPWRPEPATPALSAGDLPKIQAVCRSVARAQHAQPKVHRSATNLCILTIVNEALYHNPNIHLQVRASQPARNAEPGSRSIESQAGRRRPEHDAGRVTAIADWRRACRHGRRRLAGPGRGEAGEVSVDDIRIAKHGDATRVVIDLSKPVSYHHVSLGQPPRLAIDLPEVDWTVDADASKAVGLVQGFRFGQPRPGIAHRPRRGAAVRDRSRVRAAAERHARSPHCDRPDQGAGQWPASAINGAVAAAAPAEAQAAPWWWCGRRQRSRRRPSNASS